MERRCEGSLPLRGTRGYAFFFDAASVEISDRTRMVAEQLSRHLIVLRRAAAGEIPRTRTPYRDPRLVLVGMAWTSGSFEADEALSLQRAQAAAELLFEFGAPRDAVIAVGVGRTRPMVPDGVDDPSNQMVWARWRDGERPVE